MGKTILISSHILSELGEICDRLGIIEQGTQIFEGSRPELDERLAHLAVIHIETHPDDIVRAVECLNSSGLVDDLTEEAGGLRCKLSDQAEHVHEIPTLLTGKGIRLLAFKRETPNLEKAFMILTEGRLA